jgi:hypothetical protein
VILMDHLSAKVRSGHDRNLLTYVLVHEITHILQAVSRHSQTGIMKAHWSPSDQYDISVNTLRFAPEDVELIHLGMEVRRARSGVQAAASGFGIPTRHIQSNNAIRESTVNDGQ